VPVKPAATSHKPSTATSEQVNTLIISTSANDNSKIADVAGHESLT
jgi:hypothetical protein